MDYNLTPARNKLYKTKWALKAALSSPRLFYRNLKSFLEAFYVDARHRQSAIKTVALKELIAPDVEIALSSIHGRDGNVTVYEKLAISSLIRHHTPKILLELGTFDGNTTLQMGLNTSPDAVIHTLDLPADFLRTKEPISKADLKYVLDRDKNRRKYQGTSVEAKIIQHFGDSTNFDFTKFTDKGPVDFVFIDAGHTYECVKSDTQEALKILAPNGVLVWHDCHPFWNGVYRYLNELASERPIVRIEGTNLAYYYRA
jgi:predicted O-methyltransferase YrrM